MEDTLKSKVSEIFARYRFSQEEADFVANLLGEIDNRQEEKFLASKELFLMQSDKIEIIDRINIVDAKAETRIGTLKSDLATQINNNNVRSKLVSQINNIKTDLIEHIYMVGLIQSLAIVVSLTVIIGFMLKFS